MHHVHTTHKKIIYATTFNHILLTLTHQAWIENTYSMPLIPAFVVTLYSHTYDYRYVKI